MTSIFSIDDPNDVWRILPGGVRILAQHHYSQPEAWGVLAVSIAAIISILAIVSLFIAIGLSLIKSWRKQSEKDSRQVFIKSHAGIYFLCMLVTTLTYTIGFMLSIVWVVEDKITFGPFCNIQAALKQFGNVSTALWVFAIAVHTFTAVFLELKVPNFVFYIVFCTVWLLSGAILAVGPMFYTTEQLGPWYGISAQWCWTSDTYTTLRFATEYLWIFMAAGTSFILYSLLFLKLRGYIGPDFRFSFKPHPIGQTANRVAHQMLWYPVVYTVLVFPVAGCRIYELMTSTQSNLDLKMGSAVGFALSGLVNVIFYTLTRHIFPVPDILSKLSWRSKSKFHRLSHGSPALPIFTQDSDNLEKTSFRGSEETTNSRPSPASLRPGSAQGDRPVANANPFADTIDIIIAPPVPSYQPQGDSQLRTLTLVKANSFSSITPPIRKGSIGAVKDGRTGIRKPQAAARNSERHSYQSSGSGQEKDLKTWI